MTVVRELPDSSLSLPVRVGLPNSTLVGSYHRGDILEIADPELRLNGELIPGSTRAELITQLQERLRQRLTPGATQKARLNIAAAASTDIHTLQAYLSQVPPEFELDLLFTNPPPPPEAGAEPKPEAQVLTARNPAERVAAARTGYDRYSDCDPITTAAQSVDGLDAAARWPRLKQAMLSAIPQCTCEDIDADGLRNLLVAEQRAGNVTLASLPADFLRDVRCSASMPLRSVQQLLDDVDKFDAEFSGDWQDDALQFEQVVTNERLLNYLCTAMPGETLEALQRDASTLYFRTAPGAACQAWQFSPLSKGSPMGTWRRVPSNGASALQFDYRMGGNEMRLYGPTGEAAPKEPAAAEPAAAAAGSQSPAEAAPDEERYPCDQNVHLISVSDTAVQLKSGGFWYFTEAACRAHTQPDSVFQGCVGKWASRAE